MKEISSPEPGLRRRSTPLEETTKRSLYARPSSSPSNASKGQRRKSGALPKAERKAGEILFVNMREDSSASPPSRPRPTEIKAAIVNGEKFARGRPMQSAVAGTTLISQQTVSTDDTGSIAKKEVLEIPDSTDEDGDF